MLNYKQGFDCLARCAGCCSVPGGWRRLKEMQRSVAGSGSLPGQGQGAKLDGPGGSRLLRN